MVGPAWRRTDWAAATFGQGKAQDELVKLAIARFTSPDHPQGFGPEKAAKILQVVHENICPTF